MGDNWPPPRSAIDSLFEPGSPTYPILPPRISPTDFSTRSTTPIDLKTANAGTPCPSASQLFGSGKISLRKDDEYYIDGSFVVFLAGNYLFRVPSHLLVRQSTEFSKLYKIGEGFELGQGSSEDDPIDLEGIQSQDFRNFLRAMYPLSSSLQLSLSKDEWISVLKLSTEWLFLSLRNMVMAELQRLQCLSSVEKIFFGRWYKVRAWVIEGFNELVTKDGTISDEDALQVDCKTTETKVLGDEYPRNTTAYMLYRKREQRLRYQTWDVEKAFSSELDWIAGKQSKYIEVKCDVPSGWGSPNVIVGEGKSSIASVSSAKKKKKGKTYSDDIFDL